MTAIIVAALLLGALYLVPSSEIDLPETYPPETGLPSETASRNTYPCGDVCLYDLPHTPGKIFPVVKKTIDCPNIMRRLYLDKPATDWPPPKAPPADQLELFTQNGEMPISTTYYFQQRYSGESALVSDWSVERVEGIRAQARKGERVGGYRWIISTSTMP